MSRALIKSTGGALDHKTADGIEAAVDFLKLIVDIFREFQIDIAKIEPEPLRALVQKNTQPLERVIAVENFRSNLPLAKTVISRICLVFPICCARRWHRPISGLFVALAKAVAFGLAAFRFSLQIKSACVISDSRFIVVLKAKGFENDNTKANRER